MLMTGFLLCAHTQKGHSTQNYAPGSEEVSSAPQEHALTHTPQSEKSFLQGTGQTDGLSISQILQNEMKELATRASVKKKKEKKNLR